MTERVYITPRIYVHLCPEGQRLKDELDDLLKRHAFKEDIQRAMQKYFSHKNGIISNKQVIQKPCPECSSLWLVDPRN